MRLLLNLSFKGTNYHGWQIQPEATTIQSAIQDKIRTLTQYDTELVGCGRTDAGVHAKMYYAHFDFPNSNFKLPQLRSLNAVLPQDIAIKEIYRVPPDFHARFDATSRTYIYKIHFTKNPFDCGDSFYFKEAGSLSLDKLQECSKIILGMKDFNSFVKSNSGLTEFPCEIFESFWIEGTDHALEYHITANRFVRGMVRLIVGMCVNFALGKIAMEQIHEDISNNKQIVKSWSIAAEGLSLVEIKYPTEKMKLWERIEA